MRKMHSMHFTWCSRKFVNLRWYLVGSVTNWAILSDFHVISRFNWILSDFTSIWVTWWYPIWVTSSSYSFDLVIFLLAQFATNIFSSIYLDNLQKSNLFTTSLHFNLHHLYLVLLSCIFILYLYLVPLSCTFIFSLWVLSYGHACTW